jgi:hypothetical protein
MTGVAVAAKVENLLGSEASRRLPGVVMPAASLLLIEAEMLANKQDHNNDRLAVILAHTACDVQTLVAGSRLFACELPDLIRTRPSSMTAIGQPDSGQ